MHELQKRQKIRRILYSIPSLVLLLLFTLLLAKGALGMLRREYSSEQQARGLKEQATALLARETELKEDISSLQTEAGIRSEIRERFSVSGEGEYVAIIVEKDKSTASSTDSDRAWYAKFWHAIIPFYE